MDRAYYSRPISEFLTSSHHQVLGNLTLYNTFSLEQTQRDAWIEEIRILQDSLRSFHGMVYFEFSVPRMGRRIDVVLVIESVVFVIEFKVGATQFSRSGLDQVWDYALDLKNFHETSHDPFVCPVLIATNSLKTPYVVAATPQNDNLLFPITCDASSLAEVIKEVLAFAHADPIDCHQWEKGSYRPTPTIIEAAKALYNGHSVTEISRSDASAINLSETSEELASIIRFSRENSQKSICFLTGVPGAGKTLVGLNIATTHFNKSSELYSVFLSGNGPLVFVLREALARDKIEREKERGRKLSKGKAMSEVKIFIQNVHSFRDDCLFDTGKPPIEHVALFDEAQRAWNLEQTRNFMRRKKRRSNFGQSEPEFLISCLDRHQDWAVIVCLVGGGQEINTGEAGISEWFDSIERSFPEWKVFVSSCLTDSEYSSGDSLKRLASRTTFNFREKLHLSVSMRSFRAENVSLLVKQILDLDFEDAKKTLEKVGDRFPIVITRDLSKGKRWLRERARGSERYGIVVSSQAERLKPHAIDVKSPMDPVHWFLDGKEDVRSSYYLESVATEFHIQGLELDWACVTWDADFRYSDDGWVHKSFRGDRWMEIRSAERKKYQKNAYRVLLTRARQGMVIVVPDGEEDDQTRSPVFYDQTFEYLKGIGFDVI